MSNPAVERDPAPGNYRRVRAAVLKRDGRMCHRCGALATTVCYLPGMRPIIGWADCPTRLHPDALVAVCGDCQVITPASESGSYGKRERRRRGGRRRQRVAA